MQKALPAWMVKMLLRLTLLNAVAKTLLKPAKPLKK